MNSKLTSNNMILIIFSVAGIINAQKFTGSKRSDMACHMFLLRYKIIKLLRIKLEKATFWNAY